MDFVHIPVLLHEVLEGLAIRPDGIYVDGTVGGAGHSTEIAKRLTAGGKLIATLMLWKLQRSGWHLIRQRWCTTIMMKWQRC